MPAGDGDEGNRLGVVADLLNEGRGFLNDFVESVLAPLHTKKVSIQQGNVSNITRTLVVSILLTATMS